MEENKIINQSSIEVELCDGTHIIEGDIIEAEAVHIKIEREQSCGKALVGKNIKYTVKVINACGSEVDDIIFKNTFDKCTIFVEDSFYVDGDRETPEVVDNHLKFKLDTLGRGETITITFEVEVTEECSKCEPDPDPEKSAVPHVVTPVTRFNPLVFGTGVSGATVYATFANGVVRDDTVSALRSWSINSVGQLSAGDIITFIQVEHGKEPSDPVFVTVV